MNNQSILVVDDEPGNFEVIEALLSSEPYQLYYASSGEEAIAALSIVKPDAILLDVMMPGIDGIETCKRLKAMTQRQSIPIIMVTALSAKEDLSRCLNAGADDFICKPVNGLELRARVAAMLRLKKQYDRIHSLSKLQVNSINFLKTNLGELRGSLDYSFPNELNVSLNSVLGSVQQLSRNIDHLEPEEIRELLSIAICSAQRLDRSTRKFLMYLSLAAEATQPSSTESCKTQVISELLANQQAEQANRSEDLIFDVEDAELRVAGTRFQWVIDELIENAFRFSPAGSMVEIRGRKIDNMFHLWVKDQGEGFAEPIDRSSDLSGLLTAPEPDRHNRGMGLGLKIAKSVVKAYDGIFLVSSKPQEETTIHLTLPLVSWIPLAA
jgi:two-component system, sensor histidine kinase and response regulator